MEIFGTMHLLDNVQHMYILRVSTQIAHYAANRLSIFSCLESMMAGEDSIQITSNSRQLWEP